MEEKKIIEIYRVVNSLLDNLRINQAFVKLEEMLRLAGLTRDLDALNSLRETIKYMIHYLLEGVRDDNRDKLLADIAERMRFLADKALREAKSEAAPEYYYSVLRFNRLRKENLSEIIHQYGNVSSELSLADAVGNDAAELRKSGEQLMERLFNSLLVSFGATADYDDLARYATSGYADPNILYPAIAAVTLSLLCYYDKGKLTMLLDIYEKSDNETIAARALTAIIIALSAHGERIAADPALAARMSLWNDSITHYRNLNAAVRAIISTRDTERIASKMKDEVIPELMKLRPEIMESLKKGPVDMETAMMENNPEWEEIIGKSGLGDKLRELSEMQSDGADLMMVTFANLKNFPFFNIAANWFIPFDSRNTELNLSPEMMDVMERLHEFGAMICDSDMYSLALASARMPEAQRNMISNQLQAQFEQLSEEKRSEIEKTSRPTFDNEALKFVRDLYRFFKLFRKRDDFPSPFGRPFDFPSLPFIGSMLEDRESLRVFGEFYFKRGYYAEALPILEKLVGEDGDDPMLWEKIGFVHQSAQRYTAAAEAYEKAALLKSPGPWLTKKLAYVNKMLGNWQKAADYYLSALDMEPENVSLLMNVGNMLLQTGDVSGALSQFYHANYVSAENPKVIRAIAWGELLNGNFAKSGEYYDRILKLNPTAEDYLNAGHASMLRGELKEAVNYYRLGAENDPSGFELAFNADRERLIALGANPQTLALLLDTALIM